MSPGRVGDKSITGVATDGSGVRDIGRATRTMPGAIPKALIIRDLGYTHPGCDRPHRWCDAHRVVHWADGSPISLDNLTLLCRRHHRMRHEGERLSPAG